MLKPAVAQACLQALRTTQELECSVRWPLPSLLLPSFGVRAEETAKPAAEAAKTESKEKKAEKAEKKAEKSEKAAEKPAAEKK